MGRKRAGAVKGASETAKEGTAGQGFQKWILTNLASISVLSFLVVAIKIFRVSDMETSTALAVVTTADTTAVIRGVVISLLPAFLATLIATLAWWRSQAAIEGAEFPLPRWAAWLLFALSLFVVATVAFVVLAALFGILLWLARSYGGRGRGSRRPLTGLRLVSFLSAALALYFTGTFVLERTSMWVPEEKARFAAEDLATQSFPPLAYPRENTSSLTFVGYVLKQADGLTTMLTESNRGAVRVFVRIPGTPLKRTICLADPPSDSWFYRRPIQVLGELARHVPLVGHILPQLEQGSDATTPYEPCFAESAA